MLKLELLDLELIFSKKKIRKKKDKSIMVQTKIKPYF